MFEFFKKKKSEKRNYAMSYVQHNQIIEPEWTRWTVQRACVEGYQQNSWVHRAVYLKAKAGASVPWYVADAEGQRIDDHYLTKLMTKPNQQISKQDLFELLISWLELAGNAYIKPVTVGGKTSELWPFNPDRIAPIPSKDNDVWLAGYSIDKKRGIQYEPHEIIHLKYFNPANPLLGIAPLQAAGKTVDIDNENRNFNKSTSQNRGVVDGVFMFDRSFASQKQSDDVRDSLNQSLGNKRAFAVLGGNAKYQRTALSPVEMDFIETTKMNREEIFIVFGVPPVYAGVTEAATLNNYKTSELIFWFGTMIFLLDDIKSALNFHFDDELPEGYTIQYDIKNVPAIREAMLSKTETAEMLFRMGVPFEQLNRYFEFGFEEFDEWDKSYVKTSDSGAPSEAAQTREKVYRTLETRGEKTEKDVEKKAVSVSGVFLDILETQKEAIFDKIAEEDWDSIDVEKEIRKSEELFKEMLQKAYIDIALDFSQDFETRATVDEIKNNIEQYLKNEGVILFEISNINSTTVDGIIAAIANGIDTGATTKELQQAIIDSGLLTESRALMLARTIAGTAANIGQIEGAKATGATHKIWKTAGFEVRPSHKKMDNKMVEIGEKFKVGRESADFPLDPRLSPGERVNCRCTMNYVIEE